MPQVWYTSGCKCKGKHGRNQCTCGAVALGVAEVVSGCDDKAKQIKILRQAASFERYFKSTHHSCSGVPLAPVGTRFEWKRVKKKSAGPSRGRADGCMRWWPEDARRIEAIDGRPAHGGFASRGAAKADGDRSWR
eukprot:7383252-Prymnesium_polylepis.2